MDSYNNNDLNELSMTGQRSIIDDLEDDVASNLGRITALEGNTVKITGDQDIAGDKTFTDEVYYKSQTLDDRFHPSGSYVDTTTNQTVGGEKTFTSDIYLNRDIWINPNKTFYANSTTGGGFQFTAGGASGGGIATKFDVNLVNGGINFASTGTMGYFNAVTEGNCGTSGLTNTMVGGSPSSKITIDSDGIEVNNGSGKIVTFVNGVTELMRLNTIGLGIGTNNPTELLHLYSTVNGEDVYALIRSDGGEKSGIKMVGGSANIWYMEHDDANATLGFGMDSKEFMTIKSSGNVIVGMISNDAIPCLSINYGNSQNVHTKAQIKFGFNGLDELNHYIKTRHNSNSTLNNAIDFYVSDSTVTNTTTTGITHCMTLNQGRCGIAGVNSPNAELEVAGDILLSGENHSVWLRSNDEASDRLRLHHSDSGNAYIDYQGGDLIFRYDTAEKLRFTSTGRVGIGVTNPAFPLDVNGVTKTTAIQCTSVASPHKIRLWGNDDVYSIGMDTNYYYGGLINEYAIVFTMNDTSNRGFLWKSSSHSKSQGCMALTNEGELTVAGYTRIGYGENDTVTPSLYKLDVNGVTRTNILQGVGDNNTHKIRLWSNSDTYSIGMNSGFNYGGIVGQYAMTFTMDTTNNRGFLFRKHTHTNNQGVLAITTSGKLTVASNTRIGYGESDTTTPSGEMLDVNGYVRGASGSVIKQSMVEFGNSAINVGGGWTSVLSTLYNKLSNTRLLIQCFFDYGYTGYGSDSAESKLFIQQQAPGTNEQYSSTAMLQTFRNDYGGGTRSGTLSGLGLRTNNTISSSSGNYNIFLQIKENGDDTIDTKEGYFMISEVVV